MRSEPLEIHVDPRDFPKVEAYYAGSGLRLRLIPHAGLRWGLEQIAPFQGSVDHDRYGELDA